MLRQKSLSKKWVRLNFRDLNIFWLNTKLAPEIKGRSSGAQFEPKWNVYYLRNTQSAEREAIFEFNRRVSGWIYALIRFTFSNYSQDNYKELKLTSIEFSKRQYECDLAEAHLALFIDTEEFHQLKRDLIVSIIELEGIVSKAIYKVHYSYLRFEIELELEKSDARKQADIRSSFYNEEKLIVDAHRKDSIEQYKKVHEFHAQMTRLINTRLRQLEDFENNLEAE